MDPEFIFLYYFRPRLFLAGYDGVRQAPEEEPRLCATGNHKAGRRLELLPHRETYGPQPRNGEVQGEQATREVRPRPLHQRELQRARLLDGAPDDYSGRLLERRSGCGSGGWLRRGQELLSLGKGRGTAQDRRLYGIPDRVQEQLPATIPGL